MAHEFSGIFPAVPTPFVNGELDLDSFKKHLTYLLDGGVQGIVICGTTGEGPNVSESELEQLIKTAREVCQNRIKIVVGTGTNSTKSTIERTQWAQNHKVDGVLVVTPYYNKPTQKGLIHHYKTLAEEVDVDIIAYNVPSRTGCNMAPETFAELCALRNIVGIKEASGSLAQAIRLSKIVPKDKTLLSGEDGIFLPLLSVGFDGIVSVTANVDPKRFVALWRATGENKWPEALQITHELDDLNDNLFKETNPIPVKAALKEIGIYQSNELRLPLVAASENLVGAIKNDLTDLGLLT